MSALDTFLEASGRTWLSAITQLSVEIALLSLMILLGAWLFRIRSPSARHLLWLLLLAKPLVWTLTDTDWSVFQFLTGPESQFISTAPASPASSVARDAMTVGSPASDSLGPSVYAIGMGLWLLGVVLMFGRLAFGFGASWHLSRTSRPVNDVHLGEAMSRARALMAVGGDTTLRTSSSAASPLVTGIFRPVVILPDELAQCLSQDQLTLILAHELAHTKRWDNLVLLSQRLVESFLFFHPSIWLCGRELRREAEKACDDMVLMATESPAGYADSLTVVAESTIPTNAGVALNVLTATESHLGSRVERILSGSRSRLGRLGKVAFTLSVLMIACTTMPATISTPMDEQGSSFDSETHIQLEAFLLELAEAQAEDDPLAQALLLREMQAFAGGMMAAGLSMEEAKAKLGTVYKMPDASPYIAIDALQKVVVNPAGTNAQRFVAVGIELGFIDLQNSAEAIQPHEYSLIEANLQPFHGLMRSIVIRVLSDATIDDLTTRRESVAESIRMGIMEEVVTPHVSLLDRQIVLNEVIFTDMIIQ